MGIFSRRLKKNSPDDSGILSISNLAIPKVSEKKILGGILTSSTKYSSREKDSPKVHNENISRFPDYAGQIDVLNGTRYSKGVGPSSLNSERASEVSNGHAYGRRVNGRQNNQPSDNKHSPKISYHNRNPSNVSEDGEEYDLTRLTSQPRRRWSMSYTETQSEEKMQSKIDSTESVKYYLADPQTGKPVWDAAEVHGECPAQEPTENVSKLGPRRANGNSTTGMSQSFSSSNLPQLQSQSEDGNSSNNDYRRFKSGELSYYGGNGAHDVFNSINGDYMSEFDSEQNPCMHGYLKTKSPKEHGSIRDVFNSLGYERTASFHRLAYQNESERGESSSPSTDAHPSRSVSRSNSKSRSRSTVSENGPILGSENCHGSSGHYSGRMSAHLEAVFNNPFKHGDGSPGPDLSSTSVERSLKRSESEHQKPPLALVVPPTPYTPPATKSNLSPMDKGNNKFSAKEGKEQGFSAKSWMESLFSRRKSAHEKSVVKFIDPNKPEPQPQPTTQTHQHRRRSMDSVTQTSNKPTQKKSHARRHSQDDGRGLNFEVDGRLQLNPKDTRKQVSTGLKGDASTLWNDIGKLWGDHEHVDFEHGEERRGSRSKMDEAQENRRRSMPDRPGNRFPDAEPSPTTPSPTVVYEMLNILHKPLCEITDYYWMQEEVLGRGRYGVIRLCISKTTGEAVACKTISKTNLRWQDIEDVRREVMVMEMLKGVSNVIQLKGSFEDSQSVHIVMELCEGGELFDRIKLRHHFSEQNAAKVCYTLSRVVQKCHSKGVMHRDLKPENILLRSLHSDTDLAVIDFGLATFFKKGKYCNGIVGTPSYCAPEVLRGYYGPEADVWSMGVILYILLCGSPPFPGSTVKDFMEFFAAGKWKLSGQLWQNVSDGAKDLVLKMLVYEPEKRITPSKVLEHPWILSFTRK